MLWKKACFVVIDAWTSWVPSNEIKAFLTKWQNIKHKVEKVRTDKNLSRQSKFFPICVAIINRFRVYFSVTESLYKNSNVQERITITSY